jgi:hypothetical protein
VREAFRRCAEDGWSTQRIAQELNPRRSPIAYVLGAREVLAGEVSGTRAPREVERRHATQGIWRPGAVLRILHNATYSSTQVYERRTVCAARADSSGDARVLDEAELRREIRH